MANNSCYDCKERQLGCHSVCERYKAYRAALDKVKANGAADDLYKEYKSKRTSNRAMNIQPSEHRGFSTI